MLTGREFALLILGGIVGAIFGFFTNVFQDDLLRRFREARCGASTELAKAKAVRREAIELLRTEVRDTRSVADGRIHGLHSRANKHLQLAYDCGNAEAGVLLGQAYCYGWAVKRDSRKGWQIIHESLKRDTRLHAFVNVAGADFCPTK